MTIREIIEKHYEEFQDRVKVHNSNSNILEPDEILDTILIRAMNKYKDKDIEEEEAMRYIKRNLFMESKFLPQREFQYCGLEEAMDITENEDF